MSLFGEKMMNSKGKRGELWIVEVNGKRRPVVIVTNDQVVAELDLVIASVTSISP